MSSGARFGSVSCLDFSRITLTITLSRWFGDEYPVWPDLRDLRAIVLFVGSMGDGWNFERRSQIVGRLITKANRVLPFAAACRRCVLGIVVGAPYQGLGQRLKSTGIGLSMNSRVFRGQTSNHEPSAESQAIDAVLKISFGPDEHCDHENDVIRGRPSP